jgi:hypothetical protein
MSYIASLITSDLTTMPARPPMLEEQIINGIGSSWAQISYYVRQLVKFIPHFWSMHQRKNRRMRPTRTTSNERRLKAAPKRRRVYRIANGVERI